MMYLNQSILRLYKTEKYLGKGSGWIIDSVIDHIINIINIIIKYDLLACSSYIKFSKELGQSKKF